MSSIQISLNTPFLMGVPNSLVSPEWARFLATIAGGSASGGSASTDLQAFVYTERRPVDQSQPIDDVRTQQLISTLRSSIADLTRRVNDLEAQLQRRTPAAALPDELLMLPRARAASQVFGQLAVQGAFGCNGQSPQTPFSSGGAAPAGGTGAAAGGWDTAAHRDAAITLINNMRTALINAGLMT